MNLVVLNKNYQEPPICEKEILRYAGCKSADAETQKLLNTCINEAKDRLNYKLCYCELPISIKGSICDFDAFCTTSNNLAKNLNGCNRVIIFAATIGVEIDRLIAKYSRISPSKALMFQAIGAERIEALCDAFCNDIKKSTQMGLKPRFSPGYGDLPLDVQKSIFNLLDCSKRIGLTLNTSLLMSPSKSVTAIVGLTNEKEEIITNKCALCNKKDCAFRGAL